MRRFETISELQDHVRNLGNAAIARQSQRFLNQHYKIMPRTMLRYAIEKFPEDKRQMYLKGEI
jgi:hypothetical protein